MQITTYREIKFSDDEVWTATEIVGKARDEGADYHTMALRVAWAFPMASVCARQVNQAVARVEGAEARQRQIKPHDALSNSMIAKSILAAYAWKEVADPLSFAGR